MGLHYCLSLLAFMILGEFLWDVLTRMTRRICLLYSARLHNCCIVSPWWYLMYIMFRRFGDFQKKFFGKISRYWPPHPHCITIYCLHNSIGKDLSYIIFYLQVCLGGCYISMNVILWGNVSKYNNVWPLFTLIWTKYVWKIMT